MFAVAGRWAFEPADSYGQAEGLRGIVAGVRQLPGFVRGFWSRDADDPSRGLTYIVFETRPQADDFRRAVEQNRGAQEASGVARDELTLLEVEADA